MDKGFIMSLAGEQERLIAAEFFHLRIALPLATDLQITGQLNNLEQASEKILS